MKIKYKFMGLFCGLFIIYSFVNYIVQRTIILDKFLQLEDAEAERNLKRVKEAILNNLHHLDALNADWASWDDSYEFIKDRNKDYINSNLIFDSFASSQLNLIHLYDIEGNLVWGESYNYDTGNAISFNELSGKKLLKTNPIIQYEPKGEIEPDSHTKGILNTNNGPLLLSSRPILMSSGEGKSNGHLMMGRLLDPILMKSFIQQTKVDFSLILTNEPNFESLNQKILKIDKKKQFLKEKNGLNKINAYTHFKTIDNKTAFIIKTVFPRDIVMSGIVSLNYALYSILIIGLFVLIIMLLLTEKTITGPISLLTNKIIHIEDKEDYSQRTNIKRNDEIGFLSKSFDKLIITVEQQTNTLKKIAAIDPLTQLLNRRSLDAKFEIEWKRMVREKSFLSVILIDIDYFKKFNDHYGHQEGDMCLKKVASAIAQQIQRPADIAARYGGEEFIIILPNTDVKGGKHIAEKIRASVHDLKIPHQKSQVSEFVTCSLGLYSVMPTLDISQLRIIKLADEALYMAKEQGRNRVEINNNV